MPEKFQKFNLPSFWMSYIKVSELVVSDISKVKSFYKNLFDWTIQEVSKTHHKIYNGLSKQIAEIIEVPNSIKGKDEYWGGLLLFQCIESHQT